MASWQKYMKLVDTPTRVQQARQSGILSNISGTATERAQGAYQNVKANLPDVYRGAPNRIDRLKQFDQMDLDPIVNAGLDILADFTTQNHDDKLFELQFSMEVSNSIRTTIEEKLEHWIALNDFESRLYDLARDTYKYGDIFLIRDPDTLELNAVSPFQVDKIVVNEAKGKCIETYFIRDVSINIREQVATLPDTSSSKPLMGSGVSQPVVLTMPSASPYMGSTVSDRYGNSGLTISPVAADHVVHISLSTGSEQNWPFGRSVLEPIWKVYKQKELLEDAVVIYRMVRAPERRVFKVDIGELNGLKAQQAVERFKNEVHQKRGLSKNRSNISTMDVGYDAMSMVEDFFLPVRADGKGPSIETLPGGGNVGEITDLSYFNNQLIRGMKVPSSYLPSGDQDSQAWNDGKVGVVLVQEIRFSKYCQRLQRKLIKALDREFKFYLKKKGFTIDAADFTLKFPPPINLSEWAKLELMQTRVSVYTQLEPNKIFAKRFLLEEVMGFDQEMFDRNERYWLEENQTQLRGATFVKSRDQQEEMLPGLKSLGIDKVSEPEETDTGLTAELGAAEELPTGEVS